MDQQLIQVAADWWCQQLTTPSVPYSGELGIDFVFAFFPREVPSESIEKFRTVFIECLSSLANTQHLHLMSDYGAVEMLGDIAFKAGIPPMSFPIKTTMFIDSGVIGVSCGYGLPFQQIYPA